MDYQFSDFIADYDADEDYIGEEDELSFAHTLCEAYGGNAEYMRVLGDIYSTCGHGVKTDYNKAVFWYGRAADSGDTCSRVRLADLLCDCDEIPHDYKRAFELSEESAAEGNYNAIERLGLAYLSGLGVQKDENKARAYLEQAAKADKRRACYEYAQILKRDGADGWRDFLERSANQSYGKACWEMVGILLKENDSADDARLIIYLTQAAYADMVEAAFMLAEYYREGKHTKVNLKYAEHFYKMAAGLGSKEAETALKKYFVS